MYEMEIKAWVNPQNFVPLKDRLHQECEYRGFYDKKDRYFCEATKSSVENPASFQKIFRMRTVLQEGKEPLFLVTLKEKDFDQECEINKEIEYQVNCGTAFVDFVEALGFQEFIVKHKKSYLFQKEGFSFELNEIVGLGFFLEIEYLSKDKKNQKEISLQLKKRLVHFGIESDKIETQYYFSLLLQKQKGFPL